MLAHINELWSGVSNSWDDANCLKNLSYGAGIIEIG